MRLLRARHSKVIFGTISYESMELEYYWKIKLEQIRKEQQYNERCPIQFCKVSYDKLSSNGSTAFMLAI